MKKDFQAILLSKAIKLNRFDFGDLKRELSCSEYGSTITKYYRAWQDLKVNGRLQELSSGKFRVNN